MIRTDFANRLQPAADLALRPTPPAQEITDRLAGLVVGQRLLAEIQTLLPNGSYRAVINQRSVTLALPFAAQTGDAIELEVTENDGRLTLAVVAGGKPVASDGESTATSLSRTGQLIGSLLLDGARAGRNGSQALPLNENQPLAATPPRQGNELLPLLQQAISRSGMFYEAHQAQWVDGRYAKAELLQEPQGRLSPKHPISQHPITVADTPSTVGEEKAARVAGPLATQPIRESGSTAAIGNASSSPSLPVAPQAQAIVQQQLEAFASQVFAWHGQVWPGQELSWEIHDPTGRRHAADLEEGEHWHTRLTLTLPRLGAIDARVHINGTLVSLAIAASDTEARSELSAGADRLRAVMQQAGLQLTTLGVTATAETADDQRAR